MILYGVGGQTEHLELESSKIVVKKITRIYTYLCCNISYSLNMNTNSAKLYFPCNNDL